MAYSSRMSSWLFLILVSLILSIFDVLLVSCQCLDGQRSLLLQLKDDLEFDSTASTRLVNWNMNVGDCCRWNGVGCDTSGRVISLELDGESIFSRIENSTSLFSLQYLQKLNLAYNSFSSIRIPSAFSKLKNLRHLNLSAAGFVGQIPIEVSNLMKLVSLDLSGSSLELKNPNLKRLVQNLRYLEELILDDVDISAQRSEWDQALASSLPRLTVLSLRDCQISGPIHTSLLVLHSLSVIQLDMNNLSTTVPDFLTTFPNLRTLSLRDCNLMGTFPQKVLEIPTLQNLDLSYNKFSGSIPGSISNLHNLSRIELSSCNLSGPIPSAMANLSELTYLDFSGNNLSGPIPSFQKSNNLSYIDLSRNNLTGSISISFGGLLNLVNLNLGSNSLSGRIPSSIFALPSLRKLQLSNNQLSGTIDPFPNASSSLLDTLDLRANRLNGSIPMLFFELRKLNVLSLSSNSFTGNIQLETIKNLINLTTLDLSYNYLSVDPRIRKSTSSSLPQLDVLKLASCRLQMFPELANQSRMTHLDLSDNQIKGDVPNWIWEIGDGNLFQVNLSFNLLVGLQTPYNFFNLIVLDLHSNHLQGQIPTPPASAIYVDYSNNNFNNSIPPDIGNNISFKTNFFSLANNSLAGSIPESICNATNLLVLDFSYNSLTGNIPSCLVENIRTLGVLNLKRNNLTNSIPDTFPVGCRLKTLDLSSNALEGRFPGSLINCTALEVLNIGNNKMVDAFPCRLMNSSSLRVLVLRSNKLYGDVICPGVNNSWPELQIIDIASNKFTGFLIPEYFSGWRRMKLDITQLKGDHLRYNFLDLNRFYYWDFEKRRLYYRDRLSVTVKGQEMELSKILTIFTSIDFSNNKFTGEIPDTIGDLRSLYVLNLSHNAFTGRIPSSIGKLTSLGSLDLSLNQLTGEIPATLADLGFLSFLNLSFNELFGKIPTGPQLQTFTSASYEENAGLCGSPINTTCNGWDENMTWHSKTEIKWEYVVAAAGFIVGLSTFVLLLLLCHSWRQKSFLFIDQLLKIVNRKGGRSIVEHTVHNQPIRRL